MVEQKHTSREAPRCVRSALLPARSRRNYVAVAVGAEPAARVVAAPVTARNLHAAGVERVALVDAGVYLKPVKLIDVALNVLAGLAPCLNLGVGELGHKDLLDTIGANNRRK